MAQGNERSQLHNKNVKTLENDYVRSNPQADKIRKNKIAVLRRRRLLVFFVFAACVTAFLVSTIIGQNERLALKEEHKAEVMVELEAIQETQEMLQLQITKLEDDDYIAKLARKEYFLSDEGEIIFTIPLDDVSEVEGE